ncbi:hypothetical protein BDR05DRAFT_887946, partial [Suillus weaverae]
SQVKLELNRLFHMLRAVHIFIFSIANLTVEVDAKYIKGMINNPDLQPNTTINQWITGILLFSFELIHVSMKKHAGVDSLSRRPSMEEDPLEDNNHEDWLDCTYSFGVALLNERMHPVKAAGVMLARPVHIIPYVRCLDHSLMFLVFLDILDPPPDEPIIPQSEAMLALDEKMIVIQHFLVSHEKPTDLLDNNFNTFITSTVHYFVLEGNLWHRELQGWHQLVVRANSITESSKRCTMISCTRVFIPFTHGYFYASGGQ